MNEQNTNLPDDFRLRVEVQEKMAFVNQLAVSAQDPDFLRWLRNRLGEPFKKIQQRLDENNHKQSNTRVAEK